MNGPESRWPPALAIVLVLFLAATLPGHVTALPVWVSYLAALAVLVPMAAVGLTAGSTLWLSHFTVSDFDICFHAPRFVQLRPRGLKC